MNEPKLHHYVPQHLLRNFAVGKKKSGMQICVFDKSDGRTFRSNVDRVAGQGQYNAFELEHDGERYRLSGEDKFTFVEGDAAPVLAKILKTGRLREVTEEEAAAVIVLLALQKLRTPNFRANYAYMDQALREQMIHSGHDMSTVEGFMGPPPDANDIKRESLMMINNPDFLSGIAEGFQKGKVWTLIKNETRSPFYVGDNPLVLTNDRVEAGRSTLGLECLGIEIYFPLSPEYILGIFCESVFAKLATKQATSILARRIVHAEENDVPVVYDDQVMGAELVKKLNYLQVYYSERFLFSRDGDFELARSVLAERPELSQGPRVQVGPLAEGVIKCPERRQSWLSKCIRALRRFFSMR